MDELDLNKEQLLEAVKALQSAVTEASQYNVKQLDASELRRAALHQFMLEQNSLIQEIKYHFNQEVTALRQAFCKQPGLLASSLALPSPDSEPQN
ncbi:MAG: hypothetical protein NTV32_08240 [Gammaproteobacteria bacterium]|nr:hypothetical protein [Gammaproteobacteria bacterium]